MPWFGREPNERDALNGNGDVAALAEWFWAQGNGFTGAMPSQLGIISTATVIDLHNKAFEWILIACCKQRLDSSLTVDCPP